MLKLLLLKKIIAWIDKSGLEPKKFFNTCGKVYKGLGLKDKVSLMSKEEIAEMLSKDGMLIKRPILVSNDVVLVGFKEDHLVRLNKFKEAFIMKKDLLEKGAVLQRDKETYAIAPHLTAGIVSADELRKIADVADKYNVSAIKVTGAQRIALVGLKEEDIDSAWGDLGMRPRSCYHRTMCKKYKSLPRNNFL